MFMDKLKFMPVDLQRAYDPTFLTVCPKDVGLHKQPLQLHEPVPCKIHTRTHTQSPTGSASQIEP